MIGAFSHIAPGAHLAGECRMGDGVLVGVGAAVLPQVRLGAWSILGAGAVANKDIQEHKIAFGVPAKVRER